MKDKINIAELLKDCPQGMELDCTIYEDVVFHDIVDRYYPIRVRRKQGGLINLNAYGCINDKIDSKCVIFPKGKTTWEGFIPPCKFKDGDILVHTQNQRFIMSIYHKRITELIIKTHCILWDKDEGLSENMEICCYPENTRLATEEEKEKFFQAIKDNGYKWNPKTKTLEKLVEPKFKVGDRIRHKTANKDDMYEISKVYDDSYGLVDFTCKLDMKYQDNYELVPNKFNVTTLKAFESRVLVRNVDGDLWKPAIYGFPHSKGCYVVGGVYWGQCIPYGQNKHLLGTTDDCENFYKTWN